MIRTLACIAVLLLSACGGGSSSSPVPPPPPPPVVKPPVDLSALNLIAPLPPPIDVNTDLIIKYDGAEFTVKVATDILGGVDMVVYEIDALGTILPNKGCVVGTLAIQQPDGTWTNYVTPDLKTYMNTTAAKNMQTCLSYNPNVGGLLPDANGTTVTYSSIVTGTSTTVAAIPTTASPWVQVSEAVLFLQFARASDGSLVVTYP